MFSLIKKKDYQPNFCVIFRISKQQQFIACDLRLVKRSYLEQTCIASNQLGNNVIFLSATRSHLYLMTCTCFSYFFDFFFTFSVYSRKNNKAPLVPILNEFPQNCDISFHRSDATMFLFISREGSSHILLIPSVKVSKRHAQIVYESEERQYTIKDLGSQNGTIINGKAISEVSE